MKMLLERTIGEALMMQPLDVPEIEPTLLTAAKQVDDAAMSRRSLLVVQHDCLGHVGAPTGCGLMAGILDEFVTLESLPAAVILQGIGVRLAEATSPAHDALMRFISLKVPVLVCEQSAKAMGADCQLAGSRLASQREIAQHLISNPSIIWL